VTSPVKRYTSTPVFGPTQSRVLFTSWVASADFPGARRPSTWTWVALGTVSLVVLNAGLCLFGDAVKHRALYEWTRDDG